MPVQKVAILRQAAKGVVLLSAGIICAWTGMKAINKYREYRIVVQLASDEVSPDNEFALESALVELCPKNPEYRLWLSGSRAIRANRMLEEGDVDSATNEIDRAMGVDSTDSANYVIYARILLEQNRWRAAIHMMTRAAYWQNIERQKPNTGIVLDCGEVYTMITTQALQEKDFVRAAEYYHKSRLAPLNPIDEHWPTLSAAAKTDELVTAFELDISADLRQEIEAVFESEAMPSS